MADIIHLSTPGRRYRPTTGFFYGADHLDPLDETNAVYAFSEPAVRFDSPDCTDHSRRKSGTGFAYCPEPDAATERAWREACGEVVYTPFVLFWTALGALGGGWVLGAGIAHILLHGPQ